MAKKFSAKNYDNLTEQEKQEYKEQTVNLSQKRMRRNRVIAVCTVILSVLALYVAARAAWVRYVCIEIEDNEVTIVRNYNLFGGDISIPDEMFGYPVTAIGDGVFFDCTSIKKAVIPDSVTSMGTHVFYECENLESVILSNSLTEIPESTFDGCKKLKDIDYPENITFIGNHAFSRCDSLESFNIPNSVTEIGYNVFTCCDGLKEVKIGSGLTGIPYGTFMLCSLSEVVIPENVRTIQEDAFNGSALTVRAPHDMAYYGLPDELENLTWIIEE